ncbi:MAG: alpha-1,2-fucosyltransferase, partial [Smithella sp.]
MITLKILGGLGNQLFAFACGYSIAKKLNKELILDVADYYNGYTHPYALDALNIPVCRKLTYAHAAEEMLTPAVIPAELKNTFDVIVDESTGVKTREALMNQISKGQNIYLNGYWANHDFFSGYEDDIRLMFTPLKKSDEYSLFLETIRGECSVAVHLRRTDFVVLGNTCSDDYYQAAIAHIQSIHSDAVFYFFSDDIDYAKQKFGNKKHFRYIQLFGGMDANIDEFFCISACNHRILHNGSSFSAWASFLNNSYGKIDVLYTPKDANRPEGFICFDDQQISQLKVNFNPKPRFTIQNNAEARSCIENLLPQGKYQTILDIISELSMDAYSVARSDYIDFLADKAIASAQIGNLITAEQCLHKQAQYSREDENFHANCYVVHKALGKQKTSALHAARCANLTNNVELRNGLDNHFKNDSPEYYLYKTVRYVPKKHFIIVPNSPWFYYIKTPQSMAALLVRMGHSVSYIHPAAVRNIDSSITANQIIDACLRAKSACDSLYSYGLDLYPSIIGKTAAGQIVPFVGPLIEHLSRTASEEAVVLFRNPHVFTDQRDRNYA